MVAYHVRKRYHALSAEEHKTKPPIDLENYISINYLQ